MIKDLASGGRGRLRARTHTRTHTHVRHALQLVDGGDVASAAGYRAVRQFRRRPRELLPFCLVLVRVVWLGYVGGGFRRAG